MILVSTDDVKIKKQIFLKFSQFLNYMVSVNQKIWAQFDGKNCFSSSHIHRKPRFSARQNSPEYLTLLYNDNLL